MALAAVPAPQRPMLAAVAECLRARGAAKSLAVLAAHIPQDDEQGVAAGLAALGITARWVDAAGPIPADVLPVVLAAPDGSVSVLASEEQARPEGARALLMRAEAAADDRAEGLVAADASGWFWPVLWSYRRYFYEAAALSAVINILTLAGIIFMMTVYDRVLPNQAYVTLWSLAVGVVIAMVFEFVSRTLRGHVLDAAGKKIDLVLGDSVFAHALGTRLEHRSQSSGVFANLLKEFESVRSFVTSASLTAIADLPFAILFLIVIAIVAGPLAWVPLATFLVVAALSVAVQWPLARYANENLREGALRHGTVIESLESLETLKSLRAETRMRRRHETASAAIASTAIKSQSLTNFVTNVTVAMQQLGAALLLIWGVYRASGGLVTAGALIAAVQLSSRALAPLMSISSLALRFQSARSALASLNRVMALPREREPGRTYFSRDDWQGGIEVRGATFGYATDAPPAVEGIDLVIAPGEKVAILGRMGSGKSTLLRLLSALYRPQAGHILLDGVDLGSIEPSDVRGAVSFVGQDARLFHGSLAENLKIASPSASDADVLDAARLTGAAEVAAAHPKGFERPVGERGDTLSGGQRQAVALARALVAKPRVLLLDEPTSAMDQRSEAEVLDALKRIAAGTTLVVVTHKSSLLALADRVVVLDKGKIVADGPKEQVLRALGEGRVRAVGGAA